MIKKIYNIGRNSISAISDTEKTALSVGDPWVEREILQGNINFDNIHRIRKSILSKEEQDFLDNETNILCSMLDDWNIIHKERDMSVKVWNYMREKKFFGLVIHKKFSGKGFSAAAHSNIVIKIATKSISAAVTVMVPNSLGPGELLYHYGTDEQKNMFLPNLATGIDIPCFALTSPTAGSDATSIVDEGIVCFQEYNGKNILGINLKIDKRYITLAPIATIIGVAFKLKDPKKLLKNIGKEGITCALIPHDHPGIEIGHRSYPLGQAFMNGTIRGKNIFIPIDWIIGGQKMAGQGWRMLLECLSIGRALSLPACGVANSFLSTLSTSAYSIVREQFNSPIGNFEGVEAKLAEMVGLSYISNATRQLTISAIDLGLKPAVASAISKYYLTEFGRIVLNHAMDIHAGKAIIMGPRNYIANAYLATPISITVEGANIMTRNLIIFGQGIMRCHPYMKKEIECLLKNDVSSGLENFSKFFKKHLLYFIKNTLRAIFHSLTCSFLIKGYKKSKFNLYYKKINHLSCIYAFLVDVFLISFRAKIKFKERISVFYQ